ncbi:transcriptional regulator, Sir2 family [Ostertagia ostertagi]
MSSALSRFVPSFRPPSPDQIKKFIDQVASIDRLLVLTGAGVSTESGIPDYRSEKVGLYERSNHRPITIQEFLGSESARKRYWSRNFLAWPNFSRATCNAAHRAIASWERSDKFVWLITQNVDGLHTNVVPIRTIFSAAKSGSNQEVHRPSGFHRSSAGFDWCWSVHRIRYWSRNFLAWPNFSRATCNAAHRAIASWERSDKFVWLITQNVDGLHTLSGAGSNLLTELHGCALRVKCLGCGEMTKREDHQPRMEELNADWMKAHTGGELRPDGDVELEEGAHETFVLPECQKCGGILKTDVVFFGDNVHSSDVDACYEKVEECTGVLVLGSSLTVMSGFRFAYHASLMGKPVLIVNIGPTRADSFAEMRISAPVTEIITKL